MMNTLKSKWISDDYWLCTNHIPAPHLPSAQDVCYYCGRSRPEGGQAKKLLKPALVTRRVKSVSKVPAPKIPKVVTVSVVSTSGGFCSWPGCGKSAAPRSKYCSRDCSNKNARALYASRKVQSKSSPPPSGEKEISSVLLPPAPLPPTPSNLLVFDEEIFPPAKTALEE